MRTYCFVGYAPEALVYDAKNNSWSLRSDYDSDLHRVQFSITDDDAYFGGDNVKDEVGNDVNQTATVTDMRGNKVAAGQVYDEEFFVLSNEKSGTIWVERVEIAGEHVGYIVSGPLDPGLDYYQTTKMDAQDGASDSDNPYGNTAPYSTFASVPPCFAPGTLINTPDGMRAVETLKVGDLVTTIDRRAQPIRWIQTRDHSLIDAAPDAKPVQIKAGALGRNLPSQDLIVSPQHRILVGGNGQLQQIFAYEALAAAKSLTSLPGIRHMKGKSRIRWIHFACDHHEVVTANGCLTGSLLLGPMVLNGLPARDRASLIELLGTETPLDATVNGPPARDCLTVGMAKRLIAKHRAGGRRRMATEIRSWDLDLAMEQGDIPQRHFHGALPLSTAREIRAA